jgi:hypothetical protein
LDKLIDSSIDAIQFGLFSRRELIKCPMNTIFYNILSITMILGLILSSTIWSVNADNHELMSPRKQMAAGVEAEEVKCKSGLVLMIRSTNGFAACVKSSTSSELSNAGWGVIIESTIDEQPPEKPVEPIKSDEDNTEGKVIEVNIQDGIGSKDK